MLRIWSDYRVRRSPHIVALLLLGGVIVLGLSIYRDYGLSWDEPISHRNGQLTLRYIVSADPALLSSSERYYGTWFEVPFAAIEAAFGFSSSQGLYFFRHLTSFLFFAIVGLSAFYWLCWQRFQAQWLALLGPLLLVLSPRIFADSFYNSKDIPFMVLWIVATLTLYRFLAVPNFTTAAIHGVASGALIALRLPGLFIPALTLGLFALDVFRVPAARQRWRTHAVLLLTYGLLAAIVMTALWPWLWPNPIQHFGEALKDMSRFSRLVAMPVLYAGESIPASDLPWHYLPVWLLITTPLAYTGLFLLGVVSLKKRLDLIMACCFVGPLLAVIALNSIVYDGWRHLYFVYPAFLYIALVGVEALVQVVKKHRNKIIGSVASAVTVAVIVNFISVGAFMVRNHPYQHLYFNELVGGIAGAQNSFELDYWSLTFREGLEYIAAHDDRKSIVVAFRGGALTSVQILAPQDLSRLEVQHEGHYLLSNYRWQDKADLPHEREVYAALIDGVKVMSVYKMH